MNNNALILENLIDEDFGLKTKDNSRWGKSIEHDSLVLDKDKGIFFWNSENIVGDPLVYLTKVRRWTFSKATDFLSNTTYTGTHVYTLRAGGKEVVVYPKLVEVFHSIGKNNRDYFYRRGLTDDTIDRFQLGYYNEYSMIPFFESGTFRNFQMRRDMPTKRIKGYYKNIGPLLFNEEILKIVDKIYYVEGPVDAMILMQNGLPAISSNSGGGFLSEWFIKFIRQKEIYLIFDNDTAGEKEARRLAKFLGIERCRIYTFTEFEEKGYDPVDYFMDGYTKEHFIELVESRSKYVFQ